MLVYRPSRGNDTVTLTYNGEWTGQSLGREVVIRDKFGPTDYFVWYYSDLSTDSSWFYKPVTNVDFSTGTTYYRAIYVGPNERENLQEYIGTVASSVSTCSSATSSTSATSGTGDIQISLWQEGLFTTTNSKNSLVLDNENDTTNKLAALGATFTPSVVINQTLTVGQWIKLWIKIDIPQNLSLVDANGCYFINVGSVSIQVLQEISRLSMSKVFHGDLKQGDTVLKELIPKIDDIDKIQKVINLDPNQTHIFYNSISGGTFHDLIVERHNNIYDNKFIDVDLTPVTGPISSINVFQYNTLSAIENVFSCAVSATDMKYIVGIFATELPERNYFYIFYNQLHKYDDSETVSTSSGTFGKYNANYGHDLFYWTSGVIMLDLNSFKAETFAEISGGYENKLNSTNWTGQDYVIRHNFFMTSVSMQDDLFTTMGYNTENSYQVAAPSGSPDGFVSRDRNYFSELTFVWEKDILLGQINPQIEKAPEIAVVNTLSERSGNAAQLVIDNWNGINNTDLQHYRSIYNIVTPLGHQIRYCDLGSPHGNKLKHYNDVSISFDLEDNLSEWSSTFAFRVEVVSISAASNFATYDNQNASQRHVIDASEFSAVTGGELISPVLMDIPPSISGNIDIFALNVKDSAYRAVTVSYDVSASSLLVYTKDTSGVDIAPISVPITLYLGQENVVTVNTFKMQVFDDNLCTGRSVLNYDIYFNGNSVIQGTSYVVGSLDPIVLTYNPSKQFGGSLSYMELKAYLDNAAEYAKVMYAIHANIAWARPLYDAANKTTASKELQLFQNKRIIYFNNLPYSSQEIIIPITLQGNGYTFAKNYFEYNNEVLRTSDYLLSDSIAFDFKNINLNDIDVAFTLLGDTNLLEWTADEYNVLNDRLTIWVRIPRYSGQRIVMYYNSQRVASRSSTERPNAFDNLAGAWTMNKFIQTYGYRFIDQQVHNAGENIMYLQRNGEKYMIQIDYQYMYGYDYVYKSNKFDVLFDDRQIGPDQMPSYQSFIAEYVAQFKPDFMTIRKVDSKYNYKLEADNYIPKELQ